MKIIDRFAGGKRDERTRTIVYPTRIVAVTGEVEDAQHLLEEKSLQIGLDETSLTILKNEKEGEHASVLLDFGTELHGSLRLLTFQTAGNPKVRIRLGESVAEAMAPLGERNAGNDHSIRDTVVELPNWSDQEHLQSGFRFARIELLGENCGIALKSIVAVFIYRNLEYKGSFVCNDERLNQIYDTAAYTVHLNMQNMLWDGIKRDRLVWIGDMHPEMLTIQTVFGKQNIIEESLRFVMEQTPVGRWMNQIPTYTMWWLMIVYDWYWYTVDDSFIRENQDYILETIDYLSNLVNEDGTDTLPSYFLDWPTNGKTPAKDGVRAILLLALEKGIRLAELIGEKKKGKTWKKAWKCLKKAPMTDYSAKQSAALCQLAGTITKKEGSRIICENGAHGISTYMSYYILRALGESNHVTEALSIIKEYYGAMLDLGATTFWEDFDIDWKENAARIDEIVPEGKSDVHGDNGAYCYKGFRHSLCHGWSSGPVPFLAEQVLGIQIEEAGCKTIRLCPKLGNLEWAKGSFPTPYGMLYVEHRKNEDGTIQTTFFAPSGINVIV